ncbi:Acetyl esterase/lipase [Paenibacillus sp. UNCCL117]|uniref:alpha/beta hydrolase n=1 Tax=unclassified Paenibacillus TaxID=185978 RepID=UPI00087F45AA|nr:MULTISPECIES: alpha/beta hydrolase [unclassified Paenibacillus]SDE14267.1 Acetyl esterase/lipase [Paenibacillus sp. cl123]SFW60548.1 Acetyl esterase/lipase [Paenibacillus sp. UNCCL117]
MSVMKVWPQELPDRQPDVEEEQPTLTPYLLPAGEGEHHPAVIVCPGGGYVKRADHEGRPVAEWLNRIGISAFVLDYRVAPSKHPAPLGDAKQAIRIVRANAEAWGIDSGRIGILGFSAGGHLAASASVLFEPGDEAAEDLLQRQSTRPDLAILCYPVISLLPEFGHQGSKNNLIGEEAPQELVKALSLELQVSPETPPAFIWHTSDDASVPVENALYFAAALRRNGVPFELHSYESGRHGLGLAPEHPYAEPWTAACERWLRNRGF